MKENLQQTTRPDKDLSDPLPGFCIPTPAWLAQPVQPFQFFDIKKPHFYFVNGQAMAFAWEVTHG